MYGLQQVRQVIREPSLAVREANRLYHTRLGRRRGPPGGVDIFEEDWDSLVILDACRYDIFAQRSLPGRLESRISKGSHTSEFLAANFAGRDLRDTVYVTASPMYYRKRDALQTRFHDVVNVWRDVGWHEDFRTVLPETMADYTVQAAETYPNKRIVAHFLQPHYPFIGSTGRKHFDLDKLNFAWSDVKRGTFGVSDDVLWEAFRENLDVALPHVRRLLGDLSGRTVVTADHGQMIGERASPLPIREYGHPPGIYTDELVRVPWLVSDNGERKTIVDGGATAADADVSEEVVRDRLESLGYVHTVGQQFVNHSGPHGVPTLFT